MRSWWHAILITAVGTAANLASAGPEQDYVLYCMGCHGPEGQGVPGKVPPLAHAVGQYLRTPEGRNYLLRVPGAANSVLTDAQLTAVMNWLVGRFDAQVLETTEKFTEAEVARTRHQPLASVKATRLEVIRALEATGKAPPESY